MTTTPHKSQGLGSGATTDRRPTPEPPDAVAAAIEAFARYARAVHRSDSAAALQAHRDLRRLRWSVVPLGPREERGRSR
jgi:hypothetical protein